MRFQDVAETPRQMQGKKFDSKKWRQEQQQDLAALHLAQDTFQGLLHGGLSTSFDFLLCATQACDSAHASVAKVCVTQNTLLLKFDVQKELQLPLQTSDCYTY